jgi:hypothetical protein
LPEGRLADSAIEASAGDKEEDEAALDSVRNSTLANFPASARLRSLTLHINFMVNMTCDELIAAETKKTSSSTGSAPSAKSNSNPGAEPNSSRPLKA